MVVYYLLVKLEYKFNALKYRKSVLRLLRGKKVSHYHELIHTFIWQALIRFNTIFYYLVVAYFFGPPCMHNLNGEIIDSAWSCDKRKFSANDRLLIKKHERINNVGM